MSEEVRKGGYNPLNSASLGQPGERARKRVRKFRGQRVWDFGD
jgi:hypothetical protein